MDDDQVGWHRQQAIERFNRSWDLLELDPRTEAEDAEVLEAAMASRYHWSVVGDASNWSLGDGQIARVAAGLGLADLARWYARRCLAAVEAAGWTDFQLVSALEVSARAHAAAGDRDARRSAVDRAREALVAIDDEDDRALLLEQIDSVPEA
jgi:hypothetical protein